MVTSTLTPYLQTDKLVKRFDDVTPVDDVSLSINKGEIFALLGSSGCGKSTLLRMLAGFESPSSGRILLGGQDIAGLPPNERPVNMMFQSYALFPHLTVWDNIAFGLKREGLPKAQIAERVDDMLRLVQLQDFAKRKPHQLSGGQQQRVALARSLAKKPQLLLLDEPLGALDKKLRERTQFELVNILQSVGVTCVMVTHDQEEAMAMASRIAVMSQGRVLQVGTPKEIYETPNCRFVADFIGSVNLWEGIAAGPNEVNTQHGVVTLDGLNLAAGTPCAVAIRPEKFSIAKNKPAASVNLFNGTLREIAYFGSYNSFIVDLPEGGSIKILQANADSVGGTDLVRGDGVFFCFDAASVMLIGS